LKVKASAPGKAIVTGEHAVVYGEPAIATAIGRRVCSTAWLRNDRVVRILSMDRELKTTVSIDTADLRAAAQCGDQLAPIALVVCRSLQELGETRGVEVHTSSNIPMAAGLGSSAAALVSATAAVMRLHSKRLERETVCRIAREGERLIHVNPSGIDDHISTYGGIIYYRPSEGFRQIVTGLQGLPLVIGNTGRSRPTGTLVESVRERLSEHPEDYEIIRNIGKQSLRALDAIRRGDLKGLGEVMTVNHALLKSLGVSTQELDALVEAAIGAGALGAKLTGAGGGGCMIALVEETRVMEVEEALKSAGAQVLYCKAGAEGVVAWQVE
jgi:mevalonate kinase